jgi:UDPglucose--hexose-1-phosphate uridylyltransferase
LSLHIGQRDPGSKAQTNCSRPQSDTQARGQQEAPTKIDLPVYDPKCYLCPRNKRASGDENPDYENTFVFVNDFSAVKESQAEYTPADVPPSLPGLLLRAEPVTGKCYVLTFSSTHNLTLADMTAKAIVPIVKTWTSIYTAHLSPSSPLAKLAAPTHLPPSNPHAHVSKPTEQYKWMQIFENKGAAMGCSNPHPHGQIWTTTTLPEEPALELEQLKKYHREQGGGHMLIDYAKMERERKERVIFENETFLVLCPWWATWPFETMIVPVKQLRSLVDLTEAEQEHLAEAISDITRRYDNLFETSFPYSMGIHQAPLEATDEEVECSTLHLHFYPPLLRSATVRKFLVGYELMAEPQRDITPEQAAERLRNCGGELYRKMLDDEKLEPQDEKSKDL